MSTCTDWNEVLITSKAQSTPSLIARTVETKLKLDELHRELQDRFDNLSTAMNLKSAEQVYEADTSYNPGPSADIALIERFSHDWAANAATYRQSLGELRSAARRLLKILAGSSADRYALTNLQMHKLWDIEPEVLCLARQPLFFTEMFHGATLLPDGSLEPLPSHEAQHLRANGLLGPEDRAAVSEIYRRLSQNHGRPLQVVEIGSAVGAGSTRIAGSAVKRSKGTLYCVDPWPDRMYLAFLANMRILDFEATVVPIRSPSVEAAALFDNESLDAVFVDGSHIYPDVLADIDAYLPKIRKNGIMFGHDLHDVPSRFDRDELLSVSDRNNAEVNYVGPDGTRQRADVHAGVILAVQDRFADAIERFPGSVVWARQVLIAITWMLRDCPQCRPSRGNVSDPLSSTGAIGRYFSLTRHDHSSSASRSLGFGFMTDGQNNSRRPLTLSARLNCTKIR